MRKDRITIDWDFPKTFGMECAHCGRGDEQGDRWVYLSRKPDAVQLHVECLQERENQGLDLITGE